MIRTSRNVRVSGAVATASGTSYRRFAVAMDTLVQVRVDTTRPQAEVRTGIERALWWFSAVEAACNRFDPDSELCRLCAQTGRPVAVSPILLTAGAFALEVAQASDGAFDPTLGLLQRRRGFSRSYRTGETNSGPAVPASDRPNYRDVLVDRASGTITLRRPLLLDLGAVAKGLAIDLAAREIADFERYGVEAGGDLRAGGATPWRVGIRDPEHAERLLGTVRVWDGAVCTSGGYERPAGEAGEHHLIDPHSGRSPRGLTSVTVAAPTAMAADALATAAFVLGPVEGLDLLTREGVDGLAVSEAGELLMTPAFAERLEWEPLVADSGG